MLNVVIVMLDTMRKDHLSCYGAKDIDTPNFDKLAEKSVRFLEAFPESLPTIPVRRALHTGIRTFPFKDYVAKKGDLSKLPGWQPIPEDQITVAEIMSHNGYRTAMISDTYHLFKPSMNFHRGFQAWQWVRGQECDFYASAKKRIVNPENYLTDKMKGWGVERILYQYLMNTFGRNQEEDYFVSKVFTKAIRWVEENYDEAPFFLVIDSFDPHEPWDPPQKYVNDQNYKGKEIILPKYGKTDYLNEEELRHMQSLYAGEVKMVDYWFGEFLQKLDKLDLMNKTIIFLVSDHGHLIGEHNLTGKIPWALYPELMDIPFIFYHPDGVAKGKEVKGYVYHHDILPTLVDLLNLKHSNPFDGLSILPLINEPSNWPRSYATSAFKDYFWFHDNEFSLIIHASGKNPMLFDLKTDPKNEVNIADRNPETAKNIWNLIISDAGGEIPIYEEQRESEAGEWYQPDLWKIEE